MQGAVPEREVKDAQQLSETSEEAEREVAIAGVSSGNASL